jgi:hypothetical protein
MELPVLIQPVAGNGYQARVGDPFGWVAEGATAEEALRNLKALAAQKVANGTRIATLHISISEHPWLRWAGTLKDDPLLEEWKQAVAEYRQAIENDPEAF